MKLFEHLGIDKSAAISKEAEGNRAARRVIELLKQNPNLVDRFPHRWHLWRTENAGAYTPRDMRRAFYRPSFHPHSATHIFSRKNRDLLEAKYGEPRVDAVLNKFRSRDLGPRWDEPAYKKIRGYGNHRDYYHLSYQDYKKLQPSFHRLVDTYEEAKERLNRILAEDPVGKVRPGIEINVNDLPHDPYKFGWKGSGAGKPFEGENLFVSGAAPISAGYDNGSGQAFLARIKPHHLEQGLPTGAPPTLDKPFYTHHASRVEPEKRLEVLRRAETRLHDRKPVFDPNYEGGRNYEWENYKNYETVVNFKKPVQPRWLVEGGIARPVKTAPREPSPGEFGVLESIRPKNPHGFLPLDMSLQKVPLQEGKRWASEEDYLNSLKNRWANEYGGDLSKKVIPFKGGIFEAFKPEAFKPAAPAVESLENTGIKSMAGKLWGAAKQTLPNILKKIRL